MSRRPSFASPAGKMISMDKTSWLRPVSSAARTSKPGPRPNRVGQNASSFVSGAPAATTSTATVLSVLRSASLNESRPSRSSLGTKPRPVFNLLQLVELDTIHHDRAAPATVQAVGLRLLPASNHSSSFRFKDQCNNVHAPLSKSALENQTLFLATPRMATEGTAPNRDWTHRRRGGEEVSRPASLPQVIPAQDANERFGVLDFAPLDHGDRFAPGDD